MARRGNYPRIALMQIILRDLAQSLKPLLDEAYGEPVRVSWVLEKEKGDNDETHDPGCGDPVCGGNCRCGRDR